MIHKIHQGDTLVKENYNYAGSLQQQGLLQARRRPEDVHHLPRRRRRHHGRQLREIPSRKSCGACHDGIKWDTGTGSTLADKMTVVYTGRPRCRAPATAAAPIRTTRLQVVPHRRRHQDLAPDGEHHQEQSGDHRQAWPRSATRSSPPRSTQATRSRSSSAVWQKDCAVHHRDAGDLRARGVVGVEPADRVHRWPELPSALRAEPGRHHDSGGLQQPRAAHRRSRRSVSIASLLSTNNAATGGVVPSTTNPGYYTATIKRRELVPGGRQDAGGLAAGRLHPGLRTGGAASSAERPPCHLGDRARQRRRGTPHGGRCQQVRGLPRVVRRARWQSRLRNPGLRGLPRTGPGVQRSRYRRTA